MFSLSLPKCLLLLISQGVRNPAGGWSDGKKYCQIWSQTACFSHVCRVRSSSHNSKTVSVFFSKESAAWRLLCENKWDDHNPADSRTKSCKLEGVDATAYFCLFYVWTWWHNHHWPVSLHTSFTLGETLDNLFTGRNQAPSHRHFSLQTCGRSNRASVLAEGCKQTYAVLLFYLVVLID